MERWELIWEKWEAIAQEARYDAGAFARHCRLSPRQLQRKFREKLNRTPQEWLDEQRIEAAKQLLQSGESVKRIAYDLGFKQASHFCRQFKSRNGVTPSEFAALHTAKRRNAAWK
jgi:AraC-like DNA-binding protein